MSLIETAYGDYTNLINALDNDVSKQTIYEEVMAKEKNRIDMINRVVEQQQSLKTESSIFYNKRLIEIAITCAETWRAMFYNVVNDKPKSISELYNIFLHDDRRIYTGIMIVLIGMFLYFIDIS